MVKNLPAIQEPQVQSLGREDPLERKGQPNPVFLSGESHGQRNLAGYSPWGCRIIHDWVANTDWLTFRALNIALCSLEPPKRVKSGQDNMWPSLCLHFWYKQMIMKGLKVQTLLLNWLWLRWKWENNPRKSFGPLCYTHTHRIFLSNYLWHKFVSFYIFHNPFQ